MKNCKLILAVVMALVLTGSLIAYSAEINSVKTVNLHKQIKHDTLLKPELDEEGSRMPSRPVTALISMINGCQIPGVNTNDILSYEVYDENLDCIGVFQDNLQFASFVLSYNNTMEIRVELEDFVFFGVIE